MGFSRICGWIRRLDDLVWFGIALSNIFPEAKSIGLWLGHGWHVAPGYLIGLFVLLFILGWQPHEAHKSIPRPCTSVTEVSLIDTARDNIARPIRAQLMSVADHVIQIGSVMFPRSAGCCCFTAGLDRRVAPLSQ